MDDQHIIETIANRDIIHEREAMEEIYRQVSGPVKRFVLSNSGSYADADDIIQNAIIIFLRKVRLRELREMKSKISTYIFAVARNLWLYELRKRGKMPEKSPENFPDPAGNPDDDPAIYLRLLSKTMELIREPCRSIIRAFYLDRLSLGEMAAKFGYKDANGMKKKKSLCMKIARVLAKDLLKKEYRP